jgi:hypothetical protein
MKGPDRRRYDMLTRVRTFGTTHGQLFPERHPGHDAFRAIGAEIERLEALDVAQRTALHASRVTRKAAARAALADTLTRAGLTARVVAKANPQLEARADPPWPTPDLALLTIARQFIAGAAPYAAHFAAHGIPLSALEEHIAAFEQALHQRAAGRDDHVRARAEMKSAFVRALDAVETLDVGVVNCLAANPVAQAVWKDTRRIRSRRRSAAVVATESSAAPETIASLAEGGAAGAAGA